MYSPGCEGLLRLGRCGDVLGGGPLWGQDGYSGYVLAGLWGLLRPQPSTPRSPGRQRRAQRAAAAAALSAEQRRARAQSALPLRNLAGRPDLAEAAAQHRLLRRAPATGRHNLGEMDASYVHALRSPTGEVNRERGVPVFGNCCNRGKVDILDLQPVP